MIILGSSILDFLIGLQGITWFRWESYGGGIPVEPWQSIGLGVISVLVGTWLLIIAVKRTRLNMRYNSQNNGVEPIR